MVLSLARLTTRNHHRVYRSHRLLHSRIIFSAAIVVFSKMREPEKAPEASPKRPGGIAKIAYAQANVMTKYNSQIKKKLVVVPIEENKNFLQLQIFETITSTFCNAYTTVKQSNETITNILNETEKSIGKGSEFIGNTIDKIPSINIPAQEIIENLKISFRLTFLSTIEWCDNIVSTVLNSFKNLSITGEDKPDKTKEEKTKSFG